MRQQQEAQVAAQLQAQQEDWMRQQQMLQFQQQQQQQMQMQQQQQPQFMAPAQPLAPQPTGFGSNNPFAPGGGPSPAPPMPHANSVSFNLGGTFASGAGASPAPPAFSPPPQPASAPPTQQRPTTRADQEHGHLANLLANRDDGMDTFGNTGLLRCGIFLFLVWWMADGYVQVWSDGRAHHWPADGPQSVLAAAATASASAEQ
jgi:epsin